MCVCVYLSIYLCSVPQWCPILWNPMNCSPPGSTVHGIFQGRILEWVAIFYSRGSSWPRDRNCVSCISCIGFFTTVLPGKPNIYKNIVLSNKFVISNHLNQYISISICGLLYDTFLFCFILLHFNLFHFTLCVKICTDSIVPCTILYAL